MKLRIAWSKANMLNRQHNRNTLKAVRDQCISRRIHLLVSRVRNSNQLPRTVDRHPRYEASQLLNDVAVFRLAKDLKFSRFVRQICLPDFRVKPDRMVNRKGIVAGYGALQDLDSLQRIGGGK